MKSKLPLRLALGLFSLAGMILAFQWMRSLGKDLDLGGADTAGYVAAVQILERGSRAVLIDRDGKLIESPDYPAGAHDREIAWRPDGARLFFSSDREEGVYNIYRWNPSRGRVERRSFGSRAKGGLAFAPPGAPRANESALIVSAGLVLELFPKDGSSHQVLPPIVTQEAGMTEEGGRGDRTAAAYQRLGQSFRSAMWGPDKDWVAAVMRRDEGEVLIVQSLIPIRAPDGSQVVPFPQIVLAGQRVDFDVSADGSLVATTLSFQFPDLDQIPEQFIQNGVARPPYRHAMLFYRPGDPQTPPALLLASDNDDKAAAWPRISPDGKEVAVVVGAYEDPGGFMPSSLVRFPLGVTAPGRGVLLAHGLVREPSWSHDGAMLVFTMRVDGKNGIFTVDRDGGRPRRLGPDGDFATPIFSPQVARE